jgi:hypothetical protein
VILHVSGGGSTWVAVMDLADGSTRAIGVGYPGISQEPVVTDRFSEP